MKKCKKCGALQADTHVECIDCGERLGSPLTKQEEQNTELEVTKKITKLSNKEDYFYVTIFDKIVASLLIIGALAFLLVRIFWGHQLEPTDIFLIINVLVLMVASAFDLLFPFISWELYKLKFIFTVSNTDDMQPSDFALYTRRIVPFAACFFGYIYLITILVRVI